MTSAGSGPLLARLAERWTAHGLDGPSESELLTPTGLAAGDPAQLRFVTLVRGISGLYAEVELWRRAGELFADPATNWVFDTERVAFDDWRTLEAALGAHGLGRRRQDVRGWFDLARGLQGRFKGDVAAMVDAGGSTASGLVAYVRQNAATFPLLAGEQTARRWVDQLRRVAGLTIDDGEPLTEDLSPSVRTRLADAGLDAPSSVAVHHGLAAGVWAALPAKRRTAIADLLAAP